MICNHKVEPSTSYSCKNNNFYYFYSVTICKRVLNKRTNLGKIYLVNVYINITKKIKVNTTWLTK